MVDQSVRACHLFRVLLLSSFVSDILLLYVLSSFTFFSHPHNSSIALPSALSFFLFTLAASLSLPFHSARFVLFHLYFYLLVTSLFVYSTDSSRFPSSSLLLAARLQTREKDEMKRERERALPCYMSTREIKWGGISGNVCSGFRGGCRFFAPPYFIAN